MGRVIVVVGSLNADLCVQVPRFPAPGETISGHGFTVVPGYYAVGRPVPGAATG